MNLDERIEALRVLIQMHTESLHAAVGELVEASQKHDERMAQHDEQMAKLDALMAKHSSDIADILAASRQDGENIRGLVRIAEIHEQRLTRLEGGDEEE